MVALISTANRTPRETAEDLMRAVERFRQAQAQPEQTGRLVPPAAS